jgi:exonuclease III
MFLRIVTYNILDGGLHRERAITSVPSACAPDIVILQEVMRPEFVVELVDFFGMESFVAIGNSQRHLGLLSRFPILSKQSHHSFPPIYNTILAASVSYETDKRLYLYGIHLYPHPLIFYELRRRWEVSVALRYAWQHQTVPCLMAGDFNAIAPGDKIAQELLPRRLRRMIALQGGRIFHFAIEKVLSAGFVDCFRHLHKENGFTLPTTQPDARLDYIFANPMMSQSLRNCYVATDIPEPKEASDHYPVVAEFEIKPFLLKKI